MTSHGAGEGSLTMKNTLSAVGLFPLTLLTLSLGVGCYGGDPSASVVQEVALCGEDLLIPSQYTCVHALSNVDSHGIFLSGSEPAPDGERPRPGSCLVECRCDWVRISEAPSCGANRVADQSEVPICPDRPTSNTYTLTRLSDVADATSCDLLASRPTRSCTEVCQLVASEPGALHGVPYAMDELNRRAHERNPVQVTAGAPILRSVTSDLFCCAPNPLRRSAPPAPSGVSTAPSLEVEP